MRKKILGVAGLSALVALGLASCGNGVRIGQVDSKEIENLKDVIKESYDYEKSKEDKIEKDALNSVSKTTYTKLDTTKYTIVNDGIGDDFCVVENEKGYCGIFSRAEGKFLVKPMYYSDFLNYTELKYTNEGLCYLAIRYGGKYDYFDAYGNEIVRNSEKTITLTKQTPEIADGYYYKVTINDEVKYLQYKYSENGKLNILDKMPKKEEKDTFKKDDLYFVKESKIKHEDKEYTLKYTANASNTYINVYDNENKLFKTFEIPYAQVQNAVNMIAFDNGNTLVQIVNRLPDDAKDYSYSDGTAKYKLTSLTANIFEDKGFKEVDLGFRFAGSRKWLYDKNGNKKYAEISIQSILNDYVLGPTRYYIYTDELKLGNEMTYDLSRMAKVGDGYYDSNARILYDSDLNVVTYTTTGYNKELNAFVFTYDGYYGVVDTNGKVIVPFEYTAIDTTYVNNGKVYATNKKGEKGILDTTKNTFTSLKDYEGEDASVYMKTNDDSVEFTNLGGSVTLTGIWDSRYYRNDLFAFKVVLERIDVNTTNPETCTLVVNDGYFKENGTEITTDFTSNSLFANYTTLSTGENKNVQLYSNGSFFKVTSEANKRLTITTTTRLYSGFSFYNENGVLIQNGSFGQTSKTKDGVTTYTYTYGIEEAGTYYVRVNSYTNNVFANINLSFEAIPTQA